MNYLTRKTAVLTSAWGSKLSGKMVLRLVVLLSKALLFISYFSLAFICFISTVSLFSVTGFTFETSSVFNQTFRKMKSKPRFYWHNETGHSHGHEMKRV